MIRRPAFWAGLVAGGALAVLLGWLQIHPLAIPSSEPEQAGRLPPELPAGGPVEIWVALEALAPQQGTAFADRDWGLGWRLLFAQEFGVPRLRAPARDAAPDRGTQVVVMTRGAAAAEEASALAGALESFTAAGGVLLLEMPPSGPLQDLAGLTPDPGAAPWITAPLAPGADAPPWLPAALAKIPAPTPGVPVRAAGGEARVLLTRGDGPAVVSRRVGKGLVIGLGIDLGRLLIAWQQGMPEPDFGVPSRWSARTGVRAVQSVDLVQETAALEAPFPFADLVERAVADEVRRACPLPGWWPLPEGAPGAMVMTHDEEAMGDLAAFQADYNAETGAPATFFVVDRKMTAAGAARIRDGGSEVALHWDRGYPRPTRDRIGVGPYRPLARDRTLARQAEALRSLAAPTTIDSHRLHGLLWTGNWAGIFRQLEAEGLPLDSSLGPTGDIPPGFPFGTALPYHPVDRNGLPFRLWEVPFTFQDDERMDRGDTARLLAANASVYHGIIVPIFHSTTMISRPSVDRFEEWLGAAAEARRADHWLGTFRDLLGFLEAREGSRMTVEDCSPDGVHASVTTAGEGQAIHLPARTLAGGLAGVEVDGVRRDLRSLPAPDPGRRLIIVEVGEHRIVARYGDGRETP